jgi:hypothetical protein
MPNIIQIELQIQMLNMKKIEVELVEDVYLD